MPKYTINTDLTTRYLTELVSINSVNPDLSPDGPGEAKVAEWLLQVCQEIGMEVSLQDTAPNRPNVIARWRGTGAGKSILLTGHTDVVGIDNMQIAPFEPNIQKGRLYGRGSYDMKGGLAAILGAVEALKHDGFQPRGDIILGFVTDEETYSIGTEALVKVIKADAAILTEPSGEQICIAHRGFVWLTLTIHGLAAHGSLYNVGKDAILQARYLLDALDNMERNSFPQRSHALLGRASAHASLIEGGLGWSTYPDQCQLKIEHRLLPDETADDVLKLWQTAFHQIHSKHPSFQADIRLDFFRPGFETQQTSPIVQTVSAAHQTINATPPEYSGMLAWLDSAILSAAGIPTVILGPKGDGAHAAIEYVELDSVMRCAAVIAQATADWAG